MTLADTVTDEVRRRMTARVMSQNALARAAGMSPSLMHRTMLGERHLSIDELDRVAAVLEVTPEYLLRQARLATVTPSDE